MTKATNMARAWTRTKQGDLIRIAGSCAIACVHRDKVTGGYGFWAGLNLSSGFGLLSEDVARVLADEVLFDEGYTLERPTSLLQHIIHLSSLRQLLTIFAGGFLIHCGATQRTGLGVATHLGISFLCAYVALRAHRECSQLMEFFKRGVGGANARTSTAHARRVIQDFIDGERGNQGFGER